MQHSALDGLGKSMKAKRAKAALRQQEPSLDEQRRILIARGRLKYNLDVLALKNCMSVDNDEAKLMAQAAPHTAVALHTLADKMGGQEMRGLPPGPLSDLAAQLLSEPLAEYMKTYEAYEPADERHLCNHRGHLIFLRPDETYLNPDFVKFSTLSGTHDELVDRLRGLKATGYDQITVQLVHGHEAAIEDWANVFHAV